MSEYLLDTNAVIRQLRRHVPTVALIEGWAVEPGLAVSAVTRTEVFAGAYPSEYEQTLRFFDSLRTIPVTGWIADQAGRWIYQYARRGVQLDVPDALIAATAVRLGLVLVTSNARHFSLPELQVYELE